jgi:hypothetical protein
MYLPTVFIVQRLVEQELNSARPDAPVVVDRARPSSQPLVRTRAVTASALHRAATRIAPAA